MKPGYLFISNGRKESVEQELSLTPYHTNSFDTASIGAADEMGWTLYRGINRTNAEMLSCIDYPVHFYNQHIYRNVFDIRNNLIAYRNLKRFLQDHPDIKIIHCNTPIGGIMGRICGHWAGAKVIYMAHGFHFYKGAPLINRTIFKLIEKVLARYTDVLITINKEDYEVAQNFRLKKDGKVVHVSGVGIDLNSFKNIEVDIIKKKIELNLSVDTTLGIVVGDLNANKNVSTLIKALPLIPASFHLLICGKGPLEDDLKKLSYRLGVRDRVHFLGFRSDIKELLFISDMFLFASKREGLPRSIMEAMCCGLPCVVSDIRGNRDLIINNRGGILVAPSDYIGYADAINTIIQDKALAKQMGNHNKEFVKSFSLENVKKELATVYRYIAAQL